MKPGKPLTHRSGHDECAMTVPVIIGNARLIHGDCIEVMATLPDASVDMILCDLPYGTTECKWDTVIPFEPLWAQYRRIAKRNAAIVLTAAMPFTAALVMSDPKLFRYRMVWDKVNRITGFLDAKKRPLRVVEDVCVFYAEQCTYNPQKWQGKPYRAQSGKVEKKKFGGGVYGQLDAALTDCADGMRYPQDLLSIKADNRGAEGRVHPTQKPVALMEYLIRTYTNEGDTVMDNCFGSGTTGVACVNTGRSFTGIERERKYFDIACRRIEDAQRQQRMYT